MRTYVRSNRRRPSGAKAPAARPAKTSPCDIEHFLPRFWLRSLPRPAGLARIPGAPAQAVAPNAQTPVVELNAKSTGPAVGAGVYGASLDTWYNFRSTFVNPSLRKTGIKLVRFPGGSESDAYHWEHGGSICDSMGYITPGATFDNLMTHVARPLDLDIAITLNYGSNRACNAGGEPSEAAAWVADAKSRGYNVPYWTVGNEVYGSWEYDLHKSPHDPVTYSDAVRTGYYPAVKKANPNAKLGVVVDLPSDTRLERRRAAQSAAVRFRRTALLPRVQQG